MTVRCRLSRDFGVLINKILGDIFCDFSLSNCVYVYVYLEFIEFLQHILLFGKGRHLN